MDDVDSPPHTDAAGPSEPGDPGPSSAATQDQKSFIRDLITLVHDYTQAMGYQYDREQIDALVHWHMAVECRPWEPPEHYVHRIFDHVLGGTLD